MGNWSEKDLLNLKNRGLTFVDKKNPEYGIAGAVKPGVKIVKISVEKNTIQRILEQAKKEKLITEFVTELRFAPGRRFRFDWAIPDLKIAIEYEGIYSKKSRHTTSSGFTKDCEKYNLAASLDWRLLRYTASNYKEFETELKKLLSWQKQQ